MDRIAVTFLDSSTSAVCKTGSSCSSFFKIILVQTKSGRARRPKPDNVAQILRVAKHHRAKAVVLAEWRRGEKLELFKLNGNRLQLFSPDEIFG